MDKIINLQRVIQAAATAPGNCDRLLEISGWDEKFVGWGGKDQNIIERYLQDGRFLS